MLPNLRLGSGGGSGVSIARITCATANTPTSAGIGSISHLTLLLFNHLTGADIVHVPYRGLSEATNDLLGGQIDLLFDQVVTATPHILNGNENPIVVTMPQLPRWPA